LGSTTRSRATGESAGAQALAWLKFEMIVKMGCGHWLQRFAPKIPPGVSGARARSLALPEAYRLANRARFADLLSPDDLLQAARLFGAVGAPLALRELPSGVKVVAAAEAAAVCARVAALAAAGRGEGGGAGTAEGAGAAPWRAALGAGVSRVEAAAALGVPLPVAGAHLAAAEARGALCRDKGCGSSATSSPPPRPHEPVCTELHSFCFGTF
jgi:hypothetical protein